jgi:hypothetical protein
MSQPNTCDNLRAELTQLQNQRTNEINRANALKKKIKERWIITAPLYWVSDPDLEELWAAQRELVQIEEKITRIGKSIRKVEDDFKRSGLKTCDNPPPGCPNNPAPIADWITVEVPNQTKNTSDLEKKLQKLKDMPIAIGSTDKQVDEEIEILRNCTESYNIDTIVKNALNSPGGVVPYLRGVVTNNPCIDRDSDPPADADGCRGETCKGILKILRNAKKITFTSKIDGTSGIEIQKLLDQNNERNKERLETLLERKETKIKLIEELEKQIEEYNNPNSKINTDYKDRLIEKIKDFIKNLKVASFTSTVTITASKGPGTPSGQGVQLVLTDSPIVRSDGGTKFAIDSGLAISKLGPGGDCDDPNAKWLKPVNIAAVITLNIPQDNVDILKQKVEGVSVVNGRAPKDNEKPIVNVTANQVINLETCVPATE